MRVIAGSARSIPLKAPSGEKTRPTLDKIKETLFNCIQFEVGGNIFVDLFSGSGGIGIESLSRGAAKAYFIDNNSESIKVIKDNLNATHLAEKAIVYKCDVKEAILNKINEVADIVFMDPPYRTHAEAEVLSLLHDSNIICDDTLIIVESDYDCDIDAIEQMNYEIIKIKKYKTNQHIFLKRRSK